MFFLGENIIRKANLEDIDKLYILRVEHQKAEGKEEFRNIK